MNKGNPKFLTTVQGYEIKTRTSWARILGIVWFVFFHHSISVIHHSSPITHHSKYYTRLAPSLNFHYLFFTLFVGLIPVTHCRFFFFLPKLIEPSEKKKIKKKKKKKGKPRTDRSERKKKKKKKKKETQNRLK